jgi:hypothetical protein
MAFAISGCAGLEFDQDPSAKGVLFFDPLPVLQIACDKDGASTASVLVLPDVSNPRHVKAVSGFGSAKSSVTFASGMLVSFGQETDTKIPETLTAVTGLAKVMAAADTGGERPVTPCKPKLYYLEVESGKAKMGELFFESR